MLTAIQIYAKNIEDTITNHHHMERHIVPVSGLVTKLPCQPDHMIKTVSDYRNYPERGAC